MVLDLPTSSQLVLLGTACIVGGLVYKQMVLQAQVNEMREYMAAQARHYLVQQQQLQQQSAAAADTEAMDGRPAAAPVRSSRPAQADAGGPVGFKATRVDETGARHETGLPPNIASIASGDDDDGAVEDEAGAADAEDEEAAGMGLMLERINAAQTAKMGRLQ